MKLKAANIREWERSASILRRIVSEGDPDDLVAILATSKLAQMYKHILGSALNYSYGRPGKNKTFIIALRYLELHLSETHGLNTIVVHAVSGDILAVWKYQYLHWFLNIHDDTAWNLLETQDAYQAIDCWRLAEILEVLELQNTLEPNEIATRIYQRGKEHALHQAIVEKS